MTTDNPKHTPTPWITYEHLITDPVTGKGIASCTAHSSRKLPVEQNLANAAFIVRACNGWNDIQALRERLKELEAENGTL